MVELLQPVHLHPKVAVGVVDVAGCRVEPFHAALGELDHLPRPARVEQCGEHVERLVDLVRVPARVSPIVAPVSDAKLCREALAQLLEIELARSGLPLSNESEPQRVVALRQREDALDQLGVPERRETPADQLVIVGHAYCRMLRARRPTPPGASRLDEGARHRKHVILSYGMAKILSVSIPDELMRDAEVLARAQGRTKSELVREALRRQIQLEYLRGLQRYGRRHAEERGIGPEDAEALVDELRGEHG